MLLPSLPGSYPAPYRPSRTPDHHLWTHLRLLCAEHLPLLPCLHQHWHGAEPDARHRHTPAVLQLRQLVTVGLLAAAVHISTSSGLPTFQVSILCLFTAVSTRNTRSWQRLYGIYTVWWYIKDFKPIIHLIWKYTHPVQSIKEKGWCDFFLHPLAR